MYTQLFELHAELLKAMAHPRRLEIIHLLRDQKLPVTQIHTMLDLPQANISQHLMVLRDAGIVNAHRDGKQIYYTLSDPKFIQASDLLREILIDRQTDLNISKDLKLNMKELVPIVHDPVCQMRVSPKTAGYSHRHGDEMYYFCASGCLKKFTQKPEHYVQH